VLPRHSIPIQTRPVELCPLHYSLDQSRIVLEHGSEIGQSCTQISDVICIIEILYKLNEATGCKLNKLALFDQIVDHLLVF
jgi:hypothetical protein